MKNRFEYNFTRESEYEELKERNQELEEQNNLLKENLEELIKVNTELTESIEELNNNGNNLNYSEEIQNKIQMLINENSSLREMLEHQETLIQQQQPVPDAHQQEQTESLVNVLEELISSYKNIEVKYEADINELKNMLQQQSNEFAQKISKLEQDLQVRVTTIEALSVQLKHKDEAIELISNKLDQLESSTLTKKNNSFQENRKPNSDELRTLEHKIDSINKELNDKNQVINFYARLLANLKNKLMEKS